MSDVIDGDPMSETNPLAKLDAILQRGALERRALRLGARAKQRDYIAERDAQLRAAQDRRLRMSAALADERLDAQRFRFYFQSRDGKSLDDWRREIDRMIVTDL